MGFKGFYGFVYMVLRGFMGSIDCFVFLIKLCGTFFIHSRPDTSRRGTWHAAQVHR